MYFRDSGRRSRRGLNGSLGSRRRIAGAFRISLADNSRLSATICKAARHCASRPDQSTRGTRLCSAMPVRTDFRTRLRSHSRSWRRSQLYPIPVVARTTGIVASGFSARKSSRRSRSIFRRRSKALAFQVARSVLLSLRIRSTVDFDREVWAQTSRSGCPASSKETTNLLTVLVTTRGRREISARPRRPIQRIAVLMSTPSAVHNARREPWFVR